MPLPATDLMAVLPPDLRERSRMLNAAPAANGAYVLYWMHHAVRGHENPALDVAIRLGNRLETPVLVYQGLGGNHAYNNDRHHHFILEGARDAHAEIAARGIRTAFFLSTEAASDSPLRELASHAAVLVTEEFPAPPFPNWTRRIAGHCPGFAVAVDCCCLIPMQRQPHRFSRAYEFRRHNAPEFEQRIQQRWQDVGNDLPSYEGKLPFEPLDLARADFSALCQQCDIDHGVAPVAHTRGGSVTGYARWQRYLREGLANYADQRNDAALDWPHGVSRLSPYLHHGHISPFRIARDAADHGGRGAAKFLDELLTWRELAYNFCFFTPDPESLSCLPGWAQQTLQDHAEDSRPVLHTMEALARSRSGDELWDLAQASLRIHGELHNNLRMTWAKAIPAWRPDPALALQALIELNHRYALDGSDPNSYGGLLWALGLFDRPFPDQPVIGRIRSRSSHAHAQRLDMARYRSRVTRPSSGKAIRIGVMGAGIAGLAAARTLQDHGHRVTVFEKSRGPGGRAATRRYDDVGFDHGAQYFTARDPAFRRAVDAWHEAGIVAPWPARMATVENGCISASPDDQVRFVAVPGMNALGKHLATDLDVYNQTRIAPPERDGSAWLLRSDDGRTLGRFDAVIIATPAPQAEPLLRPHAPALARIAEQVDYDPMWAAMLHVDVDDPVGFDGLFVKDGPIGWAARNHAKPQRLGRTWVVHARPAWTRKNIDAHAEEIAHQLAGALADLLGLQPDQVRPAGAQRWLYSLAANPLNTGALWQPDLRLAACGDWCNGARIEGAYLSGVAAAARLLAHLHAEAVE